MNTITEIKKLAHEINNSKAAIGEVNRYVYTAYKSLHHLESTKPNTCIEELARVVNVTSSLAEAAENYAKGSEVFNEFLIATVHPKIDFDIGPCDDPVKLKERLDQFVESEQFKEYFDKYINIAKRCLGQLLDMVAVTIQALEECKKNLAESSTINFWPYDSYISLTKETLQKAIDSQKHVQYLANELLPD